MIFHFILTWYLFPACSPSNIPQNVALSGGSLSAPATQRICQATLRYRPSRCNRICDSSAHPIRCSLADSHLSPSAIPWHFRALFWFTGFMPHTPFAIRSPLICARILVLTSSPTWGTLVLVYQICCRQFSHINCSWCHSQQLPISSTGFIQVLLPISTK